MSLCFKLASWCLLFSQVNLRQEIAQSFLSNIFFLFAVRKYI